MSRTLLLVCTLFFVVLSLSRPLVASDDTRFIEGLRERRLFSLAETYCQQQLADTQGDKTDRVEIAVELVRTYAEHALNSRVAEREQLWNLAHEVAATFGASNEPRTVLIRVQDALTLLARGELSRMEAEVASQSDDARVAARETLRQAAAVLTRIDRELTETIPIRRRNPLRPRELSAEELTSVQNHIRYQLARCHKNQALCYSDKSSDRTASLTAATEQLAQTLSRLAPGQSLYIDLRLEQIACLRLIGDFDNASSSITKLQDEELTAADRLRVRAEQIRLQLARHSGAEALSVIAQGRKIAQITLPDLDFSFLETYISLWKSAADSNDQPNAAKWRDKSIATSKFIEQEHGAYWARRAEILLVRIGATSGDGSVDILQRSADELYRKGKLNDAIAAYDKATAAATQAEATDQSFALAYKAALICQQQKRHVEAATRFQKLGIRLQDHAHAANAHLLAIANVQQASVAAGKWLESYEVLLHEHLATWPSDQTADSAAFWLGEFESQRKSWAAAANAFAQVKPDSSHYADAVKRLSRCWSLRLEEVASNAELLSVELAQARATLRKIVALSVGDQPTTWSAVGRDAGLALATINLKYGDDQFAKTEALLKSAIDSEPSPSEQWKAAAMSVLVGLVARQAGRQNDALDLLQEIGAASTDRLFGLYEQLAEMMAVASGTARVDLAMLVINIAERLEAKRAELDSAGQLSLDQGRALALAATGNEQAAYDIFSRLAKDHANNSSIQQDYARFLLASDNKTFHQQALDQWRGIVSRTRPRTANWFQAKYSVALALFKLGDKAEAAKRIRYLQATEDLSMSGLEEEFGKLLAQCTD